MSIDPRGRVRHFAFVAVIFAAVNVNAADGSLRGWGIPMATDIAFALAVLAVFGKRLPLSLRAFLLTLAIVDDLGAIIVIAVFYSTSFDSIAFLAATVAVAVFALLQRLRVEALPLYVGLALVAWIALHQSGVHATIAGVLLALTIPLTQTKGRLDDSHSPLHRLEKRLRRYHGRLKDRHAGSRKNGRANGALRKIGATRECRLRRSFLIDDQYRDDVLWSLIDDEWRALKAAAAR